MSTRLRKQWDFEADSQASWCTRQPCALRAGLTLCMTRGTSSAKSEAFCEIGSVIAETFFSLSALQWMHLFIYNVNLILYVERHV